MAPYLAPGTNRVLINTKEELSFTGDRGQSVQVVNFINYGYAKHLGGEDWEVCGIVTQRDDEEEEIEATPLIFLRLQAAEYLMSSKTFPEAYKAFLLSRVKTIGNTIKLNSPPYVPITSAAVLARRTSELESLTETRDSPKFDRMAVQNRRELEREINHVKNILVEEWSHQLRFVKSEKVSLKTFWMNLQFNNDIVAIVLLHDDFHKKIVQLSEKIAELQVKLSEA